MSSNNTIHFARSLPALRSLILRALVLVLFTAVCWILQPTPAQAQPQKEISLNFEEVDIRVFIKFVSELTGKNFILDNNVRQRITVFSPGKISQDEVYKVFESVLQVYGFATIPSGDIIKIVPASKAKGGSTVSVGPVHSLGNGTDRMMTRIIKLNHVRTQEVAAVITPLITPGGLISQYIPSNTLIVTDLNGNIGRLLTIVRALDVAGTDATFNLIRLEYATAKNIAEKINKMLQAQSKDPNTPGQTQQMMVVPDERINELIVLAPPEQTARIRDLVARLDKPTPKGKGNIKVVYLQNADAENLGKILTGLVGKVTTTSDKKQIISGDTKIVAEKETNSLVITGDPEDFPILEEIIEKLDIPRKQVFVEALIMEVSDDVGLERGMEWGAGSRMTSVGDGDGAFVFGRVNPGATGYNPFGYSSMAGMALGVASFPIEIGGVKFQSMQSIVRLSKSDNRINIISTPQITTLDNEEANIDVVENRPYLTSQGTGDNINDRITQQYSYKDIGTKLKITPQINEGNTVKLKIAQEISRVTSDAGGTSSSVLPVTRKRSTETTVVVQDGQTIVISGLIGKTTSQRESKVPVLGDIPGLGWLFKYKANAETKTNLLVFIRPMIISHPNEAREIYFDKIEELERAQYDGDERALPMIKPPFMLNPRLIMPARPNIPLQPTPAGKSSNQKPSDHAG